MKIYLSVQEAGKSIKNSIIRTIGKSKNTLFEYAPQEKKSSEKLFEINKKYIDESDCVIAEITSATMDSGGIIVYALTRKKPVLALILGEAENKLTPLLHGNPSEWLFLEHYSQESVPYILRNFIDHCTNLATRSGKLVVIDGGDGSGKATQSALLSEYFNAKGINHRMYDFPRYYNSFHGSIVGRMLKGEFGPFDSISPYLASLAYALDRASVREEMSDYLQKGGIIISNRYATSSMAHQSAKFKKKKDSIDFLDWIYDLEYKKHKIPKEDIVIYLYVPWKYGLELDKKKAKRGYLGKKKLDLAEKNIEHRKASEKMYLTLCRKHKHWVKIDCVENDRLRSRESIHAEMLSVLKNNGILI
ncbi:MAG: hypothetical protein NUV65_01575 [Candidatus Roizmanbacteria bacterium]|nr:hypothetical protein [Candidatus Roizmanbacteria bacterium]